MEIAINQIMQNFVESLKLNNDPKRYIMKPFLRYYLESQLANKNMNKELCTSNILGRFCRLITNKFGLFFQAKGTKWGRHNKKNIFGVELPPNWQKVHDKFRDAYSKRRRQYPLLKKQQEKKMQTDSLQYKIKEYEEEEDEEKESAMISSEEEVQEVRPKQIEEDQSVPEEIPQENYIQPSTKSTRNSLKKNRNKTQREIFLQTKLEESSKKIKQLETVIRYLMKQVVDKHKIKEQIPLN